MLGELHWLWIYNALHARLQVSIVFKSENNTTVFSYCDINFHIKALLICFDNQFPPTISFNCTFIIKINNK